MVGLDGKGRDRGEGKRESVSGDLPTPNAWSVRLPCVSLLLACYNSVFDE